MGVQQTNKRGWMVDNADIFFTRKKQKSIGQLRRIISDRGRKLTTNYYKMWVSTKRKWTWGCSPHLVNPCQNNWYAIRIIVRGVETHTIHKWIKSRQNTDCISCTVQDNSALQISLKPVQSMQKSLSCLRLYLATVYLVPNSHRITIKSDGIRVNHHKI